MRQRVVLVAVAAALVLGGCDQAVSMLGGYRLDCGGAAPELCRRMALTAIDQMDLGATGPVRQVVFAQVDCERWARSNFLGDLSGAIGCWTAEVTGERSHGGGTIVLRPDGSLQAIW